MSILLALGERGRKLVDDNSMEQWFSSYIGKILDLNIIKWKCMVCVLHVYIIYIHVYVLQIHVHVHVHVYICVHCINMLLHFVKGMPM